LEVKCSFLLGKQSPLIDGHVGVIDVVLFKHAADIANVKSYVWRNAKGSGFVFISIENEPRSSIPLNHEQRSCSPHIVVSSNLEDSGYL
jgi:hypothetical protein